MTLVQQIDGEWMPVRGVQTLARMVATCTVTYHDGRQTEAPCEPYPVTETLDLGKVEQMLAEGLWGADELARYGLRIAHVPQVPESQRCVGEPRYVEQAGEVVEEWDLEDVPAPAPEPTPAEKLAALGLSVGELKQLLGTGAAA